MDQVAKAILSALGGLLSHPVAWVIIALMLFGAYLNTPFSLGRQGESLVRRELKWGLPANLYTSLHNLLIPDGKGGYSQIDHVVFSRFGIFVIETKHYTGWISGKANDPHWKVSYNKHSQHYFLNPLLQNKGHIQALCRLLDIPESHCFNVVAFTGSGKLRSAPIKGVLACRLFSSVLADYIKVFKTDLMQPGIPTQLAYRLRQADQSHDPAAKKAHLQAIKEKELIG